MLCNECGDLNLHFLWDDIFGKDNRPEVSRKLAEELLAAHPQPRGASNLDEAWFEEGFDLARKHVYIAPIQPDGSRSAPGQAYRDHVRRIAGERVVLAGLRIANLFNDLLR